MNPHRRASSRLTLLLSLVCSAAACSDGGATDSESSSNGSGTDDGSTNTDSVTESETEPGTESEGEPVGWFELGWGEGQYVPIADGDPLPIVRGGQGAEMFPLPLRGAEFYLPSDIVSWMDETGPLVDLEMDIEGYNDGIGGHFKRIANYTLDWVVLEDGTYQSSFLPVLVPDGIDTDELEGLPAHLTVRLRPYEQPPLTLELDVVVTVMSEPPPV